jgi:hypothetical protein
MLFEAARPFLLSVGFTLLSIRFEALEKFGQRGFIAVSWDAVSALSLRLAQSVAPANPLSEAAEAAGKAGQFLSLSPFAIIAA